MGDFVQKNSSEVIFGQKFSLFLLSINMYWLYTQVYRPPVAALETPFQGWLSFVRLSLVESRPGSVHRRETSFASVYPRTRLLSFPPSHTGHCHPPLQVGKKWPLEDLAWCHIPHNSVMVDWK